MCDTLGFFHDGKAIFAKNSDRSPNEPQVLEFIPATSHSGGPVDTTYASVPGALRTKAILISRPSWMWGAEMGVNECGVCIGNEAVFTKGAYHKDNDVLTGMDLLRIGLEQGETAEEARDVIINYLTMYGQGGNCAYDHKFYYDNSFLIMDRQHIFILETAGKEWVYREVPRGSISNRLAIRKDGDRYSAAPKDFVREFRDPVYSKFSGSKDRLAQSSTCLVSATNVYDMMRALRTHAKGVKNPFTEGTVDSVCMHYGGAVGDHTTASMIVELGEDITVWVTGTSTPCVSLFKPYKFGNPPVLPIVSENDPAGEQYWRSMELIRRGFLGKELPEQFFAERDALEREWLRQAQLQTEPGAFEALAKEAHRAEAEFYERWSKADLKTVVAPYNFRKRWGKKTNVLKKESE